MEDPRRMTGHPHEVPPPDPPPEALRISTSSPDRFTSPTLGRLRLAAATAEKHEYAARKRAARAQKENDRHD